MQRGQFGVRSLLTTAAAIGAATLARWLLMPLLPESIPFITFFPVMAVATWYGGRWMGVIAAFFCYVIADYLFIPPIHGVTVFTPKAGATAPCIVFLIMSGLIIGLAEALRLSQERAEESAQRAAREHRILDISLRSIGDGVIATDANGKVTILNPVAEALTGWTQVDAQGRPLKEVFRIVNEQTHARVEDPCAEVLRTGRVVGLANHTILIAKDGSERPIDDSAAPIQDESGKVHGVILVFRDATDARRAHEGLQRLASIVESSEDAIIGNSIDGTITSWNAGAERMYGYTAAEAVGQDITLIVPDERRTELASLIQRVTAGETIPDFDTVRRRKDGSQVDVSLQVSPITNSEGEVIGTSKVDRDITLRKRRDAALQFLADTSSTLAGLTDERSALQQAAGTMVPFVADWCVLLLVNDQGQIELQACAHADPGKQSSLEQMLQHYPFDWSSPAVSVEAIRKGTTQVISDVSSSLLARLAPNPQHLEILRQLNPKSIISVPLQIRGQTLGAISFVYGDANRRYTTQDIALAEDLARRVSTAIDNARLLSSLRTADEQKNEFLAMLAHELRNPLAAIQYAAEVAGMLPPQQDGNLFEVIKRQVQQLTHMIDDLLDLSRISRNKIQLRKENIDAATLARRAADTLQPLIDERKHRLIINLADEPLPLHVDPTRIEQVVGNLLTNAAKYTPEGGEIQLSTGFQNGGVVIRVRDTGIGIAPEILPHIFELFTQASATLDRSQGGLGIGLSVARKLVELHGGTISARSAGVGHGSEFSVRLPRGELPSEDEQSSAPQTRALSGKLRILIVEDNHDTAEAAALLLKAHGHEVSVAYDGLSGLEEASRHRPDAMVIDLGLPGLNGFELASRLRESGTDATLVAVSGYGQLQDKQRSRAAGFDAHLVKPVTAESLLSALGQSQEEKPPQALARSSGLH